MKILIIGCGSIGRRHAANGARFAETAVVDVDFKLANEVAIATGTRVFRDVEQALAWKPDGVVVATPHDSHLRLAEFAIKSGADVLIEKPISNSEDGVGEFVSRVEKLGRRAFVVCNMRFHPGPATLKQYLHEVGKPLFSRAWFGNYLPSMRPNADYRKLYAANRKSGGGVILDAIHEVDYLCWLFGNVDRVSCNADKLSDLEIDVEDYAEINLTHSAGVRSSVHLDYLQQFKRRGCEIVGSAGTLIWESEGKQPERCLVRLYRANTGKWETLFFIDEVDTAKPYMDLMEVFTLALSGASPESLLDSTMAAKELHLALAAHRSARQRRTIETI